MADLPSTDWNKKFSDQSEVGKECEQIEAAIHAMRVSYEQYFLGFERHAPTAAHQALKQRINRLRMGFVRQTAIKFRVDSLHNKFLTYERLWARTLTEMENGTYRRDLFKARLHAKKKEAPPKPAAAPAPPAPGQEGPPAARAPGIAPVVGRAPPPPATGLSDAKLKAIFEAYVTAKKRCNEDVSKLSFDTLASTLKKQVPELMKQHKAKSIEFKVVIKDGKAVLRAVPKE